MFRRFMTSWQHTYKQMFVCKLHDMHDAVALYISKRLDERRTRGMLETIELAGDYVIVS